MYEIDTPERIKLNAQIRDWNANRLDLFQISEPNDKLEFYGVMRFFYQGDDLKYQTKCLRVNSTASTKDVLDALKIKFHPDSKTLNNDKFILYETHNLEERRMKSNEHPLIVQLNWALDDKDGKFILKNESRRRRSTDLTNHAMVLNYGMSRSTCTLTNGYDNQSVRTQSSIIYNTPANFFSRRFSNSKKSKKQSKAEKEADEAKRLAEEISGKPPESSFTRTISNPDDVMKRRRQKKLEFRLEQFSGVKGDGETGGTLKIYGDSINPEIPYKTLLLSVNDTTEKVLSETLDKYGLSFEEHKYYILVQQNIPPRDDRNRSNIQEIILHKQDCPLGILVHCPPKRGFAIFSVRKVTKRDKLPTSARMPPFAMTKEVSPTSFNAKSNSSVSERQVSSSYTIGSDEYSDIFIEYPRLRKLNMDDDGSFYDAEDGMFSLSSLINNQSKNILSNDSLKSVKLGSQTSSVGTYPNILLPLEYFSDIRPFHCHISAKMDPQSNSMKFQITPSLDSSSRAPRPCVIFINQHKIERSTKISNGDIIQLGETVILRFEEFNDEYESINTYSIEDTDQSIGSLEGNTFTADLPITVKYKYNNSEAIVNTIMTLSKDYAEEGGKELFSSNIKSDNEKLDDRFTLSTTYILYLVMREGLLDEDKIVRLIDIVANRLDQVIQEDQNNVEKEIFWLSNCSELLHLLQYDSDLRHYSSAAQDILVISIERAFSIIQEQFAEDLLILLPAILNEDDSDIDDNTQEDNTPCLDRASILNEHSGIDYPIQHLLQTLSFAFNLFQNCQVNVALTVQMFSQLFHLLNTWLLNKILGEDVQDGTEVYSILICQEWGNRLMRRLNRIKYWSEINGLEMAANCHLQKIYEVAELMQADKRDLSMFGEKCIEMVNLNGSQLHHLLINCQDYELPNAWIEVVVNTAIQLHDQNFNDSVNQNNDFKNNSLLFEDMQLRLPLLLPADGYCCDRGISSCPHDLKHMLTSLKDLIRYNVNSPILDEMDVRWKSYLSTYENTPTVSRSNTIEQLPSPQSKTDVIYIPKNTASNPLHSEDLSASGSDSTPKERYQKKSQTNSTTKDTFSTVAKPACLEEDDYSSIQDIDLTVTQNAEDIFELKLNKIENSLGLSIIAAKASNTDTFRIYVKDIIVGGAGFKSGKIFSGDQIVSIDGNPLVDMNQDEAVVFMKKTKSQVTLVINKSAAVKHGVMDVINQARNNKVSSSSQKQQRVSNIQAPPIKPPPSKPTLLPKSNLLLEDSHNKNNGTAVSNDKKYQKSQKAQPTILNRKISDSDVITPDYNSLPVRKINSSQGLSNIPIYATIKNDPVVNKVNEDNTHHSLQNVGLKSSKSNSHPNLSINPMSKNLSEVSSSGSSSSYSISSSDEDESLNSDQKIENNQKRNSSSVYDKLSQNQSKPISKVQYKAVSDLNIHSNLASIHKQEDAFNKTFISKTPAPDSDCSINSTFNDDTGSISLNKPVLINKSYSSESETISSNTESTSENQSKQLQRKLSSEPVQSPIYNNYMKPEDFNDPSKKSEPLPQRKLSAGVLHLGGFKKPIKLTNTKSNEQLTNLSNKGLFNSTQPKIENENNTKSNEDMGCSPISKVNLPPPTLPPPPVLQYRPPNDLEEYDWTHENKPNFPKIMNENEKKVETRSIAANIKNEKKPTVPEVQSHVSSGNRADIRYGRPQFSDANQSTRPLSLLKPETNNNVSSPASMLKEGLVLPPSLIIKSKVPNDVSQSKHQDDVDELSFKEKMKLFASKIGEENIVERKKFGSKHGRMESGDYS